MLNSLTAVSVSEGILNYKCGKKWNGLTICCWGFPPYCCERTTVAGVAVTFFVPVFVVEEFRRIAAKEPQLLLCLVYAVNEVGWLRWYNVRCIRLEGHRTNQRSWFLNQIIVGFDSNNKIYLVACDFIKGTKTWTV